MAGTGGHGRRPGPARLFAVVAVLLGLFLMHGSPASAAVGCHLETAASASMSGGQSAHGQLSDGRAMPRRSSGPSVEAAGLPQPKGALCVSTAAREQMQLAGAAVGVLPVLGAGALQLGRPAGGGSRWRRGPPGGGRALLLRVCVART